MPDELPNDPTNNYLDEMTSRFEEGLCEMLREKSDVFAFPFDVNPATATAPQTAIVLIRPKAIADEMLSAIEYVRSQAAQVTVFDPARPVAAKAIDPR